jgi:hypothetical protein
MRADAAPLVARKKAMSPHHRLAIGRASAARSIVATFMAASLNVIDKLQSAEPRNGRMA